MLSKQLSVAVDGEGGKVSQSAEFISFYTVNTLPNQFRVSNVILMNVELERKVNTITWYFHHTDTIDINSRHSNGKM